MILFKQVADISAYLERQGKKALQTGFVPTMGALHQGHLSLIKESKKENELTVCSIFVNPTQFNDPKDFEKYPTTIEQDIYQLETAGCDVLFLPNVAEMYPKGTAPVKHYELGYFENILEGKYRPGHFQGVCQVVDRLLQIVQPDIKETIGKETITDIKANAMLYLSGKGFKPDYIELADATTLEPIIEWNGQASLVALVAAFLNEVRLIDNIIIE